MDAAGVNAHNFVACHNLDSRFVHGTDVFAFAPRFECIVQSCLKVRGGTIRRNQHTNEIRTMVHFARQSLDIWRSVPRSSFLRCGIKRLARRTHENCASRTSPGACDKATFVVNDRLPFQELDRAMIADYDVGERDTQRASLQRRRRGGRVSLFCRLDARRVRAGYSHVRVV